MAPAIQEEQFYAFISYKRRNGDKYVQDEKWANLFYQKLRSWGIPVAIQKKKGALIRPQDRRISPVFLDKRIMNGAGGVTEQLDRNLARSRCLVVVCSPGMIENQKELIQKGEKAYIFQEIDNFLSTREHLPNREDRVILAWIGPEKFNPAEHIPPLFDKEKKVVDFLEHRDNKEEKGKAEDRFVSEIAASIFQENKTVFWDSFLNQQRRRKARIVIISAIVTALMLLMGFGILSTLSSRSLDKARSALAGENRRLAAEHVLDSYHYWPWTRGQRAVMWDCLNPARPWMVFHSQMAVTRDLSEFAVFDENRNLTIYDARKLTVKESYQVPGSGESLLFSPDGQRIAIYSDYHDADLYVCDRTKGEIHSRHLSHNTSEIPVFNMDGSRIYYGLRCLSSDLDTVVCHRFQGDGAIHSASFLGTNIQLATISERWDEHQNKHYDQVRVYDLQKVHPLSYKYGNGTMGVEPLFTFDFPKETTYAAFFSCAPRLFYVADDHIHFLEFGEGVTHYTSQSAYPGNGNWTGDYSGDSFLFDWDSPMNGGERHIHCVNKDGRVSFVKQADMSHFLAYTNADELLTRDDYGRVLFNSYLRNRSTLSGLSLAPTHEQEFDHDSYRAIRIANDALLFEKTTLKNTAPTAKTYLYTEEDLRNDIQIKNGFTCEFISPNATFLLGRQEKADGLVNLARDEFHPFDGHSLILQGTQWERNIAYLPADEKVIGILLQSKDGGDDLVLVNTVTADMRIVYEDVKEVFMTGPSTALCILTDRMCLYDFSLMKEIRFLEGEYTFHDHDNRLSRYFSDEISNVSDIRSLKGSTLHRTRLFIDEYGLLKEAPDSISFGSFSPGGKYLLRTVWSGGGLDTLQLRNTLSFEHVLSFPVANSNTNSLLLFSPDDHYLVFSNARNTLDIFNLERFEFVAEGISYHPQATHQCAISRKYLLVYDGLYKVYELSTGRLHMSLALEPLGTARTTAFSPNERWLAIGPCLIDLKEKECVSDNLSDNDDPLVITDKLITYRNRMVTLPEKGKLLQILKRTVAGYEDDSL